MCPGSAGVRAGEPPGAGVRGSARPHAAARAAEPRGDARGARAAGAHGHQGPRLHGAAPAAGQPPPRQPRLRPLQPRLQVLLPRRGPLQVSAATSIPVSDVWLHHFCVRVGTRKLKAKMCTSSGKFETVPIPANYQEPQRKTPQIFLLRT